MSNNLLLPPTIIEAGPYAGVYHGDPRRGLIPPFTIPRELGEEYELAFLRFISRMTTE